MKKRKEKQKEVAGIIMQLDFFTKRAQTNANNAYWAVLITCNEDGDEFSKPVVVVGDGIYYDILSDEIKCLNNVGGCVSKICYAIVTQTEPGFLFESNLQNIFVSCEKIYNLYKNKFVYQENLVEAKCLSK